MAGRGQHGVDPAVGPGRLQGLDPLGWAEQPGGGVEELDAVLDGDAAAGLPVPEAVAGPQALVAGQVLQGEAAGRRQDRLLQPAQQGVQRVAAEHVVDRQPRPAGPGGRRQQLGGVLQPGRQRLLAVHVPAGAQGGQGQPGVAGRWGGDGHRGQRVGEQLVRRAGGHLVAGGQRLGPGRLAVGHGHRAQPWQLGGRLQDQGPVRPAPTSPETQVGGRARRPDGPLRPRRPGRLRGSAWRSFTGSSRPVGVT